MRGNVSIIPPRAPEKEAFEKRLASASEMCHEARRKQANGTTQGFRTSGAIGPSERSVVREDCAPHTEGTKLEKRFD